MPAPLPEGTRRISAGGYVQVKVSGQRRWPFEHRLVWEAANGPIPPGHIIHHVNGLKTDNRLDNLALTTQSEHARTLHGQRTKEHYRQIGLANRGITHSAERREKIAAVQRGQRRSPHTLEARAKISEGIRRAYTEGRRTDARDPEKLTCPDCGSPKTPEADLCRSCRDARRRAVAAARVCTREGCERQAYARGYCQSHYVVDWRRRKRS